MVRDIERKCWTCKCFTYMAASHGVGWCTFGPPVRDVQEDAAIAGVTCHPRVMHGTYCHQWETDERTMERVDAEADAQELQRAYRTLGREERTRKALLRELRAAKQERAAEWVETQEHIETQIRQWERQVDAAHATIERLGENKFMEAEAERGELDEARS